MCGISTREPKKIKGSILDKKRHSVHGPGVQNSTSKRTNSEVRERLRIRFLSCLGCVPESGKGVKSTLAVQNIFMNCVKSGFFTLMNSFNMFGIIFKIGCTFPQLLLCTRPSSVGQAVGQP